MRIFRFVGLVSLLTLIAASPAFAQQAGAGPDQPSLATSGSTKQDVLIPAVPANPTPSKVDFLKVDNGRFYGALSASVLQNNDRKIVTNMEMLPSSSSSTPDENSDIQQTTLKSRPALALGGKLGVRANEQVAFEVETNYTKFNGSFSLRDGGGDTVTSATRHTQFINFANVVITPATHMLVMKGKDGTTLLQIDPNFMAGVGFVHESIFIPKVNSGLSRNGLAANVGAGLEAKYGQMLAVGVQYRYLMLNNGMSGYMTHGYDEFKFEVGRNNAHMMTAQASLRF